MDSARLSGVDVLAPADHSGSAADDPVTAPSLLQLRRNIAELSRLKVVSMGASPVAGSEGAGVAEAPAGSSAGAVDSGIVSSGAVLVSIAAVDVWRKAVAGADAEAGSGEFCAELKRLCTGVATVGVGTYTEAGFGDRSHCVWTARTSASKARLR